MEINTPSGADFSLSSIAFFPAKTWNKALPIPTKPKATYEKGIKKPISSRAIEPNTKYFSLWRKSATTPTRG